MTMLQGSLTPKEGSITCTTNTWIKANNYIEGLFKSLKKNRCLFSWS